MAQVHIVEAGLTLARDDQPTLTITNIQLPGMDGVEATALLKCHAYLAGPMYRPALLATIAAELARA